MRLLFHISILGIIHLLTLYPGTCQSYELSGIVKDSSNNLTLPYANVVLQENGMFTLSDSKGNFMFTSVAAGKYTLVCSIMGYATRQIEVEVPHINNQLVIALQEALIDINEVVVTATRTNKLLKQVPVLTHVIHATQIENSGITNVAEAVNNALPGIDFYNEGSGMTLRMQGLDTKYTLILMDGERIAGENHGNIDYSRLNTSNIERIEIVKGASSSLYGSSAIGGVINIITRKPVLPFETNLYSRYSKYNELETGADIGFRKNKLSSFTNAVRQSSDGYDLTPGTPDLYTVEPYKIYSVFQKFTYDLTKNVTLTARGSYFSRERFDVSSVPTHPLYTDYNAGVGSRIRITDRFNLSASIYGDHYQSFNILERRSNERCRIYRDIQITGKMSGEYIMQHRNIIQQQTIIGGMEFFSEEMYSERIQDSSKGNTNLVFFVQDDIQINNQFNAVAGARIDIHSEFGTNVSPKASLMYSINKIIYRATYGYGFRAPGIKERYYDFDLGFLYFQGNKNLKPETSHYTSLSAEYLDRNINISLSAYNSRVKDMIIDVLIAGSDNGFTYVNLNKAIIYGIDNMYRMKIVKHLICSGGYSFTYATDKATDKELTGFSKHSGSAGLEYVKRFKGYSFNILFQGRLYSKKEFANYNDSSYTFYNETYPAYSLWKLVVVQEFFNSSFRITCGVDNLFNYHNSTDLININPGRRYFCAVNISCEKLYGYLKQKNQKPYIN